MTREESIAQLERSQIAEQIYNLAQRYSSDQHEFVSRQDFLGNVGSSLDREPEGPCWEIASHGLFLAESISRHPDDPRLAGLADALEALLYAFTDGYAWDGIFAAPYVRDELEVARATTQALLCLITTALDEEAAVEGS